MFAIRSLAAVALIMMSFPLSAQVNPIPRQRLDSPRIGGWTFDGGVERWRAAHDCSVHAEGGVLVIQTTGGDPYLISGAVSGGIRGPLLVKMRMRCQTSGSGQFFWVTRESPRWGEKQSAHFPLVHDNQWRDYEVELPIEGELMHLRLDPGGGTGEARVDSIALHPLKRHPLSVESATARADDVQLRIRNHESQPRKVVFAGRTITIPGNAVQAVTVQASGVRPFEYVRIQLESPGLPPLQAPVYVYRPRAKVDWIERRSGDLTLQASPDGYGARVLRRGRVVAFIAPLVHRDYCEPRVQPVDAGSHVRFAGEGVTVDLALAGNELSVTIDGDDACEGPVVRTSGELEQGLFAGLEYLGKGEASSSKLDIETPKHVRYAPDPLDVTMPLMAFRTADATVAMTWDDMSLQPVYATPNFLDGAQGHRMALRGKRVRATVLFGEGSLEDAILWCVRRHGLPPLPQAPRTRQQQWDLALRAIRGPIAGEGGWGHCAEAKWKRHYYADMASTIFRLTGNVPETPRLVPGGAHIRNDAIWFLTGRAQDWLKQKLLRRDELVRQQRPDGSYRYQGKYQRGHFEDTASGFCARPTAELLEFAWLTGDSKALEFGVRGLEYMRRFRTPRGAQTWELSLHTPDILASAYLVWAYVRGYQLTGNQEYRQLARKWALTGIPFVYQWSRYPIMAYATPPVYGATNWRAPHWIGLPVQWCGGVYAYALTKLAPYDDTIDWRRLARGILHAGEQMEYPDGPLAGCLPDVFSLRDQRRSGPSINPCAMASLRMAVEGVLDSLAVATEASHRVTAPFPVELKQHMVTVHARKGLRYQVLIDGARIVDIESKGVDTFRVHPAD